MHGAQERCLRQAADPVSRRGDVGRIDRSDTVSRPGSQPEIGALPALVWQAGAVAERHEQGAVARPKLCEGCDEGGRDRTDLGG